MFCMTATDWFNMLFVIFGNLQARLQPTQLDIYEAHGTGTSLGDPIEVSAVRKVRGGLDLVGWGLAVVAPGVSLLTVFWRHNRAR